MTVVIIASTRERRERVRFQVCQKKMNPQATARARAITKKISIAFMFYLLYYILFSGIYSIFADLHKLSALPLIFAAEDTVGI